MSKTVTRYPLAAAAYVAQLALAAIGPFVARAEVAGSVRRGLARVGDVDLVVGLEPTNPWAEAQMLGAVCAALGYDVTRQGPQAIHLEARGEVPSPAIDIYIATPETWGITLLVRTGSAAHNIRLAQRAGRRLPARKFTLHGIEDSAGRVIGAKAEQEVFDALGLFFIEPREREAPELEHMVRPELL